MGSRRRLGWFAAARLIAREAARSGRGGPGWGQRLRAVPAVVSTALRGGDPQLSRWRAMSYLLAALYVLSPVDLAPEVILPVVGLADDAAVLVWLVGNLLRDVDAVLGSRVVEGDVLASR
ncbi:MAG: YkvA family protein [Kineosporiaceae bacterium]